MDYIWIVFVVIIFLCLLVALPVGIIYLSWTRSKYVKYPISIIFCWYVFMWWRAFYPADEFFINQFKKISGFELPNSAVITDKYVSYPGFHNDYDSCFVFKLPKIDLDRLISNTTTEPVSLERNCNGGITYKLILKGKNYNNYPFMSWYITEQGYIWSYYASY